MQHKSSRLILVPVLVCGLSCSTPEEKGENQSTSQTSAGSNFISCLALSESASGTSSVCTQYDLSSTNADAIASFREDVKTDCEDKNGTNSFQYEYADEACNEPLEVGRCALEDTSSGLGAAIRVFAGAGFSDAAASGSCAAQGGEYTSSGN